MKKKKLKPSKKLNPLYITIAVFISLIVIWVLFFPLEPTYKISADNNLFNSSSIVNVRIDVKKPIICVKCPDKLILSINSGDKEYTQIVEDFDKDISIELEDLSEGENELTLSLVRENKVYDTSEVTFLFDKTPPELKEVKEGEINEEGVIVVSTNGIDLDMGLIFSEEVEMFINCEEDVSNGCHKVFEFSMNHIIEIIGDRIEKENEYSIDLEVIDRAGNIKIVKMQIQYDGSGPEISLVSTTPYNVSTFFSCSKGYTLQLKLDEEGVVLVNGEKLSYNKESLLFEKAYTLEQGVRVFKVEATDLNNNITVKDIEVDGICRIPSEYGDVHPWLLQEGIIACSTTSDVGVGSGYNPCIANYINVHSSEFH